MSESVRYLIKREFRSFWNSVNDVDDDSLWIVSETDVNLLASIWGVAKEKLLEQVDMVSFPA